MTCHQAHGEQKKCRKWSAQVWDHGKDIISENPEDETAITLHIILFSFTHPNIFSYLISTFLIFPASFALLYKWLGKICEAEPVLDCPHIPLRSAQFSSFLNYGTPDHIFFFWLFSSSISTTFSSSSNNSVFSAIGNFLSLNVKKPVQNRLLLSNLNGLFRQALYQARK